MTDVFVSLVVSPYHVGPLTTLPDSTVFPAWVKVDASVDGEVGLALHLVVEDGRPVLDSVSFVRPRDARGPLSASRVHAVPLDTVVRRAVALVATHFAKGDEVAAPSGLLHARGRRVVTDELLREVAEVVRADPRGTPNKAVQQTMHTSARNASRWIKAARERGFLSEGSDNAK